jgi:hypothetical protein
MRTRSLVISGALIFVSALAMAVIALAADPFVGTWKMNLDKSDTTLLGSTDTWESRDDGYKVVQDMFIANGMLIRRIWGGKYGEDVPVKGGMSGDAACFTKVDTSTIKFVFKKSGKEIERGQMVISKDGKSRTITGSYDEMGKTSSYSMFQEKQ